MQEVEKYGGEVFREFFSAKDEPSLVKDMKDKHAAAIADPDVKRVTQVKLKPNDKCSCGSGLKFKKCCMWLVKAGHIVHPTVPVSVELKKSMSDHKTHRKVR